jgi:hypothetical protein
MSQEKENVVEVAMDQVGPGIRRIQTEEIDIE